MANSNKKWMSIVALILSIYAMIMAISYWLSIWSGFTGLMHSIFMFLSVAYIDLMHYIIMLHMGVGIIALIFGIFGKIKADKNGEVLKIHRAGLIMGIIGTGFPLVLFGIIYLGIFLFGPMGIL